MKLIVLAYNGSSWQEDDLYVTFVTEDYAYAVREYRLSQNYRQNVVLQLVADEECWATDYVILLDTQRGDVADERLMFEARDYS